MHLSRVSHLLMCAAVIYSAQAQTTKTNSAIPLMRQLYVQDQRDRGVILTDAGEDPPPGSTQQAPAAVDQPTLIRNDAKRRDQVRALLAAGSVITAQDFHDAAYIFQHSQNADDYLLAHILAIEAVVKGDASSKWIAAATLDRYLQPIGQKQVFGTQYSDEKFAYYLQHKADPDLKEKIAKIGDKYTQQPYNDLLIPDHLRLDFCVPQRAQQTLNLQEFDQGRYPKGILPPGCTR